MYNLNNAGGKKSKGTHGGARAGAGRSPKAGKSMEHPSTCPQGPQQQTSTTFWHPYIYAAANRPRTRSPSTFEAPAAGTSPDHSVRTTLNGVSSSFIGSNLAPAWGKEVGKDHIVDKQLLSVRDKLFQEIELHGKPLCYLRGDFYDRPPHPVFAMQTSVDPSMLYWRDVFVWLPHLLPGCPDSFMCTCGKSLLCNGLNDDPIVNRVHAQPADFFLLTNRFICDPRNNFPGCGSHYQGSGPHILSQLPPFVQSAFQAVFCSRTIVSKQLHTETFLAAHADSSPDDNPGSNDMRVRQTSPLAQAGHSSSSSSFQSDASMLGTEASQPPAHTQTLTEPLKYSMSMAVDPTSIMQPSISTPSTVHQSYSFLTSGPNLHPPADSAAPSEKRSDRRCAACVKNYCKKRFECRGRGGHSLCGCGHQRMAPGERCRISEENVLAFLGQQDQNRKAVSVE